jgi:hypothetical protein
MFSTLESGRNNFILTKTSFGTYRNSNEKFCTLQWVQGTAPLCSYLSREEWEGKGCVSYTFSLKRELSCGLVEQGKFLVTLITEPPQLKKTLYNSTRLCKDKEYVVRHEIKLLKTTNKWNKWKSNDFNESSYWSFVEYNFIKQNVSRCEIWRQIVSKLPELNVAMAWKYSPFISEGRTRFHGKTPT